MNNRYPGGKGSDGIYQQIINHIPPHKIFVSAFAGKCGIFRNIMRTSTTVLNDRDPEILKYWRSYLHQYESDILINENFIQMQLFGVDEKKSVILRNNDALHIIDRFKNSGDAFIYCDPPYPNATRRSTRQIYAFQFHDEQQHKELLAVATSVTANIMISTYENELYDEYLINKNYTKHCGNWYKHKFQAMTRGGIATECIYMNYPPPAILHDFRYIGKNFRERERIKKKVARHKKRLAALPESERCAILSAIIQEFQQTVTTIIDL